MNTLVQSGTSPEVHFYGWEVVKFWFRQITEQLFTYSWQVRTAYFIVLLSILIILLVAIVFTRRMRVRNKKSKMYEQCQKRFHDAFYTILASDFHYSVMNVEAVCECSAEDLHEYSGATYSRLLCNIRTEMRDKISLPNMQLLAELTDVRGWLENNLTKGNEVLTSLQVIATLPVRISEGRLATYTNHYDMRTRHMARQVIGFCTENDPFRYLEEDLNDYVAPYRYMSMHRMFGWLYNNDRQMPDFLTIAEHLNNDKSAAFMIEEVAYWGNDAERNAISEFFHSDKIACRIAAIKVIALLQDLSKEDELVALYPEQPADVKKEILTTIAALNSGNQAPFIERAYLTSPSKDLAEHALACLFRYGTSGRKRFESLRQMPLTSRSKGLLEQIEMMGQLEEMRASYGKTNEMEAAK